MITDSIKYVGVDDRKIDLFEGQYKVPEGISYNSYVITDEKIAVMDTVSADFKDEWLGKLKESLSGRAPDYLVILHMEPDHSANILSFTEAYPSATVVASQKAFAMMKSFYGTDFQGRSLAVKEGDELSLGKHTLKFIGAPMVHWPEVMVAYDTADKTLFSADAFGKFGVRGIEDNWVDEARRYYIGIVGKYGAQVKNLLKKASSLDIERICPLHGPVLDKNLDYYLSLYSKWADYEPEEDGVVIAYTSVYGNTRLAAELLHRELGLLGVNAAIYDLARCDMAAAVADAFRYSKLVLATTTYNADIFPFMREFISHLTERNFQKRKVALIENGSWAPMAANVMKKMLSECKNIEFAERSVKIISALNDESVAEIKALAKELVK